jgi:hypothetical protein
MFMVKKNFDGMEQKDIVKLAEMELGRDGKTAAKNPKNHAKLAIMISDRLHAINSAQKWQEECGIDQLVRNINNMLLCKV